MTKIDSLCALIYLALICGGLGGFDSNNSDGCCGRCGGGVCCGVGVVGGGRAGSIGCN